MRRICGLVLLGLLASAVAGPAHAQNKDRQKRFEPFLTRSETTWSVGVGARINDFRWDIANDITGTTSPNIAHEQTWTDVKTIDIKAGVRHVEPMDIFFVRGGVQMEAELTGGLSVDGRSLFSTYDDDNRTNESTRQSFGSISGDSIGASAAVGYKIHLTGTPGWKPRNIQRAPLPKSRQARMAKEIALQKALRTSGPHISFTPLLGYAADQQTYHREDAFNHIDLPLLPLGVGPFHTESDLIANWYGPFIGLEGEIRTAKHMFRLRGELHDLTYYGKGIEPSRADDFEQDPSYDHEADGEGLLLKAEYAYALGDDYALTFDAFYRERETDPGTYTVYPRTGNESSTRLNGATDEAQGLHVGLRYNWN